MENNIKMTKFSSTESPTYFAIQSVACFGFIDTTSWYQKSYVKTTECGWVLSDETKMCYIFEFQTNLESSAPFRNFLGTPGKLLTLHTDRFFRCI